MKNMNSKSIIPVGDIGGTKTNLRPFIREKRRPLLKVIKSYPGQGAPKLKDIIEQFLEKHSVSMTGRHSWGEAGSCALESINPTIFNRITG